MKNTSTKRTINSFRWPALLVVALALLSACGTTKSADDHLSGYLFAYFTGNGPSEEAIHFAVSIDGYNYRALNNNQPILDSKQISTSGGVRDPHILRGADGKSFYMVATDLYVTEQGWNVITSYSIHYTKLYD